MPFTKGLPIKPPPPGDLTAERDTQPLLGEHTKEVEVSKTSASQLDLTAARTKPNFEVPNTSGKLDKPDQEITTTTTEAFDALAPIMIVDTATERYVASGIEEESQQLGEE